MNRELYMKTGQGFLLVFSITSLTSLTELAELREQIIRIKDDENVPIVIVGNKSDLEEDRLVSRTKAFSISQSWGNAPYYETSARRRGGSYCHPHAFFFSSLALSFPYLIYHQ
jgi:small GTP-binding protein